MGKWNEKLGNNDYIVDILKKVRTEGEQLVPTYEDDEASVAISIGYEKYKGKDNFVFTLDVRDNEDGSIIPVGLTVFLEDTEDGILADSFIKAIVMKIDERNETLVD